MQSNPIVSVIVNCHNGEKFLEEALNSIYEQTFLCWELIFFDNASTDNSKNICKNYDKRLRYFFSKEKLELGNARLQAISHARGKYFAFLDVDDVWRPNFLENSVGVLDKHPKFQMSYSGSHIINENSIKISQSIPIAKSGKVLEILLRNYEVVFQSVLIRNNQFFRHLYQKIKHFQFCPDYYLVMNIAKKCNVYVIHELLVNYRKTKNSLTYQKPHRWSVEVKITLDSIFKNDSTLKNKIPKLIQVAYAKVYYKKADYFFIRGRKKLAINSMKKIKYVNIKYFILFLLSILGSNFWNLIHNMFKK